MHLRGENITLNSHVYLFFKVYYLDDKFHFQKYTKVSFSQG